MLKLYALLIWEFMKIGLFAIGGGYAALPFLFHIQREYGWFTAEELTDIIAVSNITPGPVGINAASYAGYKTAGVSGAFAASFAVLLIPFILTVIISKLFTKFKNNKNVNYAFTGLRAAGCALLSYIAVRLSAQTLSYQNASSFDKSSLLLFIILVIPFFFTAKNPVLTILAGAAGGILINNFISN